MPKGHYERIPRVAKLKFDHVTAARLDRAAKQDGTTVPEMLTSWVEFNLDAIDPAGASTATNCDAEDASA